MTTISCTAAILLAVLTIPLLLIWRASESNQQRASRLRRQGWSWNRIADRLGCSASTARRWAAN